MELWRLKSSPGDSNRAPGALEAQIESWKLKSDKIEPLEHWRLKSSPRGSNHSKSNPWSPGGSNRAMEAHIGRNRASGALDAQIEPWRPKLIKIVPLEPCRLKTNPGNSNRSKSNSWSPGGSNRDLETQINRNRAPGATEAQIEPCRLKSVKIKLLEL